MLLLQRMRPARHFTDLLIWQLSDQLRIETIKLTKRPQFGRNFRLREQTDDAIDSVCRNIAEGFAGDTHGQFASYLRISRRSLCELKDAFISAEEKQLASPADLVAGRQLIARIFPQLDRLIAYLERNPKQRNRPPFKRSADDGGFYFRID